MTEQLSERRLPLSPLYRAIRVAGRSADPVGPALTHRDRCLRARSLRSRDGAADPAHTGRTGPPPAATARPDRARSDARAPAVG